jgi:Tfp pilus assembly protein PilX
MSTNRLNSFHRQRGVSTLIVVMVLLFVVTMVAAYTSRNMIFEQRTGANYLRAANAGEVAEAGLQWALAQLNTGRINDACVAVTSPSATDPTFRQRYLSVALDSSIITPLTLPPSGAQRSATCVFDPDALAWSCSCVQTATTSPSPPTTSRVAPAFRVRFETGLGFVSSGRPALTVLNITACTRMTDDCLTSNTAGVAQEARAVVRALAYQSGGSVVAPIAALTARGAIDATGLTVSNSRFGDSGITVHAGGAINNIGATPGLLLNTLAGNALSGAGTTLPSDTALAPAALPASSAASGSVAASESDRFFALCRAAC